MMQLCHLTSQGDDHSLVALRGGEIAGHDEMGGNG